MRELYGVPARATGKSDERGHIGAKPARSSAKLRQAGSPRTDPTGRCNNRGSSRDGVSRMRRRLAAVLLSEPRWLRGLDWRLIALGGLIAAIGSSRVWITAACPLDARVWITAALPGVAEQATSREIVLLDLWAQATIALL